MAETPPGFANLKAWFKLNDNAATSVVINEVGDNGVLYSRIGDVMNTAQATVASGNPPYLGGAFNFGYEYGDAKFVGYVLVSDSAALSITGDISFSFHMYKDADADYEVLGKGTTDGQRSYYVGLANGQRVMLWVTPDGTQASREYCITDASVHNDRTWVHVVLTYDADGDSGNGYMRCYIDSVEVTFQANKSDTLPNSIHDSTEQLQIADWVNHQYFDGKFDNIMIFNKVLTQNEINWLYNSGNGRENPFMPRPLVGGSLAGNSLVGKGLAR